MDVSNKPSMWQQIKSLSKNSAIYGLGSMATVILSFLMTPLYTHILPPNEFGVYSLIFTIYGLVSYVADCGLASSLPRHYLLRSELSEEKKLSTEEEQLFSKALISNTMVLCTIIGFFVSFAIFFLSDFLSKIFLDNYSYSHLLKLVALTVFFRNLTITPQVYLRITERATQYTILTTFQVILYLSLNLYFLLYLKIGIEGLFISLLVSTFFHSIALIVTIVKFLSFKIDLKIFRDLLSFGLPYVPVTLMIWVIDLSDRYLLGQYTTFSEVGVYSLGYKFGQVMTIIVTAFLISWDALRFKIMDLEEPQVIYGRIATFYLAGVGWIWMIFVLSSHQVVALTSPPQFAQAAIFIAPIAMAYLIYGLFGLAITGVGIGKKTGSLPIVAIVAAAVNVLLNIALIPHFGAIAAAYATIVSYIVLTLGSLYASNRTYPISYEYQKMAYIFVIMLTLGIGGSTLDTYFQLPQVIVLAIKIFLLVIYWFFIVAIRTFRRNEVAKILNAVAKITPVPIKKRLHQISEGLT